MEKIKLNIVPSGANPTCYASQYDAGRVIRLELFDGLTPYAIKSGDTFTLNVRKPDNTIVTTSVTGTQGNNYIDITTSEQICACVGFNLCDLTITNGATKIGTLNFIMSVERDVLADGIPSESVIEDLDERIAEAIGDDYYNKTETDALLDLKADKSTTYTKTETDNLLAAKANSSDVTAALALKANTADVEAALALKANTSDVEAALAEKANTSGEYDNLTVGNAKQLVSTVSKIDKTPYNFRTSGGTLDIGDRETDMIVGGSVAFNQLLSGLVSSTTKDGLTITNNNDGSITISGTASATDSVNLTNSVSIPRNTNKILFNMVFSNALTDGNYIYLYGYGQYYAMTSTGRIFTRSDGTPWVNSFALHYEQGTIINTRIWVNVHNLTQIFGSTIADYIYNLEQANTGAGVAYFRKLFPKPYYAYNAGELMSVKTSAHRMVGFNQFGSSLEFGNIDSQGMDSGTSKSYIRSVGYTKVLPNTTYCFYASTPQQFMQMYVIQYDANKNFISRSPVISGSTLYTTRFATATLDANTHYIRVFIFKTQEYTTPTADICINLSWDGERNGEYEPYEVYTYPLDSDLELRGIPKLDANNNLYYDGDEYTSDGNVKRNKFVTKFDGTEEAWSKDTNRNHSFVITVQAFTAHEKPKNNLWFDSSTYIYGSLPKLNTSTLDTRDGIYCQYSAALIVTIMSCSTLDEFKAYLGSHPIFIGWDINEYTETADAYQNPQIVNDFGTEEYIDNRAVAIPVGHVTEYQANLRAKLEMAPDSPQNNGDYLLRHNNGANEYVAYTKELPTAPTSDGTYKLVCTVSGGTPSYSWVSDT